MIDFRTHFLQQFDSWKQLPMFQRMKATVEGSPWHREANVLVHTEMVVSEYLIRADRRCTASSRLWNHEDYLGAVACAFHDVGKPPAEKQVWKPDRGDYRAYHGHEILSARMFESFAMSSDELSARDVVTIAWMIETHMPWSIENKSKLDEIAMTAQFFLEDCEVWFDALLADQYGRTSDDAETKRRKSDEWVEMLRQRVKVTQLPSKTHNAPTLYMPIATSGSGKSTYLTKLKERDPNVHVFSLDILRHEFYDPVDYAVAFTRSVEDKSFTARANARFHQVVKQCEADGCSLYVDNVNLSAKRRGWYLTIARKHGFNTTAILLPVSLQDVLDRQHTRTDKTVPDGAVISQYNSLQMPMIGEFNDIVISSSNIR